VPAYNIAFGYSALPRPNDLHLDLTDAHDMDNVHRGLRETTYQINAYCGATGQGASVGKGSQDSGIVDAHEMIMVGERI
jgi:hypothetical protein